LLSSFDARSLEYGQLAYTVLKERDNSLERIRNPLFSSRLAIIPVTAFAPASVGNGLQPTDESKITLSRHFGDKFTILLDF
jgi:hypothetical protein